MTDEPVTDAQCMERSGKILAAIERLETRLFRDNGTLSVQTRLDRHEQTIKGLSKVMWGVCSVAGVMLVRAILVLVVK